SDEPMPSLNGAPKGIPSSARVWTRRATEATATATSGRARGGRGGGGYGGPYGPPMMGGYQPSGMQWS
ncbi:unnamed protein product, partial [Vitrella brassicaformis CCMP3155]